VAVSLSGGKVDGISFPPEVSMSFLF
jgi:hypothetical protein